jgi:hypothetical protein
MTFLHDTNVLITTPQDVQKVDILDYFSHLAKKVVYLQPAGNSSRPKFR